MAYTGVVLGPCRYQTTQRQAEAVTLVQDVTRNAIQESYVPVPVHQEIAER